jgi:hypothetical protein
MSREALMPETPREKYERLKDNIQNHILTSYPNPERKGCPGDEMVRAVAGRRELVKDEAWQHITHCSPCYAEFIRYKRGFRGRRKRTARLLIVVLGILLVALLVWIGRRHGP